MAASTSKKHTPRHRASSKTGRGKAKRRRSSARTPSGTATGGQEDGRKTKRDARKKGHQERSRGRKKYENRWDSRLRGEVSGFYVTWATQEDRYRTRGANNVKAYALEVVRETDRVA